MLYRIYRIKEAPREHFRWAAHTGGTAVIKLKDYEMGGELEAPTPYTAWKFLSSHGTPLQTGDVLEEILSPETPGALYIVKYVGFEKAAWLVPEPKTENRPILTPDIGV